MHAVNADDLTRLVECNGSRLMLPSSPHVEGDRTARDEGDAAHYMAVAIFNGEFTLEQLVDQKAPNGVYMTSEMSDYVQQYLIALECGQVEVNTSFGNDQYRVNARCDHVVYQQSIDTLTIDDFKYGWGLIEPENNWTLAAHAIGYCLSHSIQPARICLRIHQPRPYHPHGKIRSITLTFDELWVMYQRIDATMLQPTNELHTGLSWCVKCDALATCPAAHKANMNAFDATDVAFDDKIPNDVLSYNLDLLRNAGAMIKNRLDALENLAMHRLKIGEVIDNYAVENQFANTRWKTGLEPSAVMMLTGKDLSKPGLVTPGEAKKRGVPELVIKSLTERPMTGIKLVRAEASKRAEKLLGNK
jgi:Protein of unknown function (DUF2800)